MVMQRNANGMLSMALIRKKAYENKMPIHATFELTPRCGFNCRMCYVHLSGENISKIGRELTADEWLDLGRQAVDMGVLSLCITGGDPVCHPEFKKIWTGLSKMGFRIILQTNASQLTDDILELLEEYPPDTVKITLYGSNDDIYKDVCCVENGFTRTVRGIKALQERNFPIQLVTTFVKQNKDDANNIAKFAQENNLAWIYSLCCYPSLRGAKSDALECALSVWDIGCEQEAADEYDHYLMKDDRKPIEYCKGYRTEFNISWDGMIRFCLFLNEPNISVLTQSLQESWDQLIDYCDGLQWPAECTICKNRHACKRCLAKLACHSGGLGKINKNYCKEVEKIVALKQNKNIEIK